jgi:hypothetical protein
MKLKDLKKGDLFTKKVIPYPNAMQVFVRGEYDRTEKKYLCTRFGDANDSYLISGEKEVYTDFIF